jgi:hypothetical protein
MEIGNDREIDCARRVGEKNISIAPLGQGVWANIEDPENREMARVHDFLDSQEKV